MLAGEKDITHALDWMVQRVLEVAVRATKVWRECYDKFAEFVFFGRAPKPRVPEGCFDLGIRVEVSWTMGQGSRATVRWLPAPALGLHDNKDYVVRFEKGGGVTLNAMFIKAPDHPECEMQSNSIGLVSCRCLGFAFFFRALGGKKCGGLRIITNHSKILRSIWDSPLANRKRHCHAFKNTTACAFLRPKLPIHFKIFTVAACRKIFTVMLPIDG